ncbi:MAG TPA: hypothetical protein VD884_07910 [Ohtaekwangia sp.]|nr:hypothetical protein [Ohtaekwangia sp.]
MRFVFIIVLTLITTVSTAQVGRVDITLDTVPLGGDEQRDKMQRMKAHDELKNDLVVLRDSIKTYTVEISHTPSDKNVSDQEHSDAKKKISQHLIQLDKLIDQFQQAQADVSLNRKAYAALEEIRRDFNAIRQGKQN